MATGESHPSQVKCAIHRERKDGLDRCQLLVRDLGLTFAAIDLVVQDGEYFFLEVNPTGEWGWVMDIPDVQLDQEIAELLILGRS